MDNSATINTIIGIRINTLLAKNGVKQKELAKVLGVNDNVISYYCKGSRKPNIDQLNKIADFFHTSVDYLLGRTNVISTDTNIQMICEYTGLSEEAVNNIADISKNYGAGFDIIEHFLSSSKVNEVADITEKYNTIIGSSIKELEYWIEEDDEVNDEITDLEEDIELNIWILRKKLEELLFADNSLYKMFYNNDEVEKGK